MFVSNLIGSGVFMLGDCLELMQRIPDQSIDAIVTDPPYNTTLISWDKMVPFEKLWVEWERILKPNANILVFGNQPFTSKLVLSKEKWFKQALIWDKNKRGSPALAKKRLMQVTEDIILFSNGVGCYNPQMEVGKPYSRKSKNPEGYVGRKNDHKYGMKPRTEFSNEGTRYPKNIIRISRDFSAQQQIHPTQKPIPLYEYLLKTYTREGDAVLDCFAGIAPLAIAAEKTKRNWICIESDESYYHAGMQRIIDWRESHQ